MIPTLRNEEQQQLHDGLYTVYHTKQQNHRNWKRLQIKKKQLERNYSRTVREMLYVDIHTVVWRCEPTRQATHVLTSRRKREKGHQLCGFWQLFCMKAGRSETIGANRSTRNTRRRIGKKERGLLHTHKRKNSTRKKKKNSSGVSNPAAAGCPADIGTRYRGQTDRRKTKYYISGGVGWPCVSFITSGGALCM